jgi:hypothetical protein
MWKIEMQKKEVGNKRGFCGNVPLWKIGFTLKS